MSEVLEGYQRVCRADELPVRGKKTVSIDGMQILIVSCEHGICVIEDKCPQTGRPIAHGKVIEGTITSPHTGAKYDLQSGKYLGGGQSPFQSHWLTLLKHQIIDGVIYVRA